MESQIFQRVITDIELLAHDFSAVGEQVSQALRILNEQCARYIADNLPVDAYQLLKIDRMVTRDEAMARTIVAVRLEVGEVTRHPRLVMDSDSRQVYQRPPLADLIAARSAAIFGYAGAYIDNWRQMSERVRQATDGEVAPVYGSFPAGYHAGVDPANEERLSGRNAQAAHITDNTPKYAPTRRHICVGK